MATDSQDQIVIEYEGNTLIIVGFNPNIAWVEEDKFFKTAKQYTFITDVSDWEYAMLGVRATYNEDIRKENDIHQANMKIDLSKKILQIQTDTLMKSHRKIAILDGVGDDTKIFEIGCISLYLSEIAKYFDRTGRLQMEIIGPNSPIVVHDYAGEKVSNVIPARANDETGIIESFSVFFSVIAQETN
jgi:hypothetical protein